MGQITIRVNELIKTRELREGRRLPRTDVARAIGISPETLSELASQQATAVTLDVLARLCAYFQCTTGDVLYYDADPESLDEDELESRDIVARWESVYGADEHPPDKS